MLPEGNSKLVTNSLEHDEDDEDDYDEPIDAVNTVRSDG